MFVSVPRLEIDWYIELTRCDICTLTFVGTKLSGTCGGTTRMVAIDT